MNWRFWKRRKRISEDQMKPLAEEQTSNKGDRTLLAEIMPAQSVELEDATSKLREVARKLGVNQHDVEEELEKLVRRMQRASDCARRAGN